MKLIDLQKKLEEEEKKSVLILDDWTQLVKQSTITKNKITVLKKRSSLSALDKNALKVLESANAEIEIKRTALKSKHKSERTRYITDFQNTWNAINPIQAIEELDDSIPIMMIPVRVETQFVLTPAKNELWIRIFPDSLFQNHHTPGLSADEYDDGKRYWQSIWNTRSELNDEVQNTRQQDAWKYLSSKYNENRSAWISKLTRPIGWTKEWKQLSTLQFPPFSDTVPALSGNKRSLLPSHFVVEGYDAQDRLLFQNKGAAIPPDLVLAPDVNSEEIQLTRDAQHRIKANEEIKWMFDFDEALAKGMAIKIPVNVPSSGELIISKLIVIGIKLHYTALKNRELIEDWIENHNYSQGFSIIPQGTATNNKYAPEDDIKPDTLRMRESIEDKKYFTPATIRADKKDGQYLTEALGIQYSKSNLLPNGENTDVREAMAFNTAMYPGTLGLYFDEIVHPLLNEHEKELTKKFFIDNVSGRSTIPAVRIGSQPYGVLITSTLQTWKNSISETGPDLAYWDILVKQLKKGYDAWVKLLPSVSFVGKEGGDAHQHFLQAIGLLPSSAAYHSRKGITDLYAWNYLQFKNKMNEVTWARMKAAIQTRLQNIGIPIQHDPLIEKIVFLQAVNEINGPLIDEDPDLPFSETDPIQNYNGTQNYIHWLMTSDFETIKNQKFTGKENQTIPPPKAVLYNLLRRAYLEASADQIQNVLIKNRFLDIKTRKTSFKNIDKPTSLGKDDFFTLDASKLRLTDKKISIWDYIKESSLESLKQSIRDVHTLSPVPQVLNALRQIADLPTAKLERLLAEHIDCCTYRLDAWITGLFSSRLHHMRIANDKYLDKGIHIGAYGYIENLKPDRSKKIVEAHALPDSLKNQTNIIEYQNNAGFIQAPSLTHAATAAILRNAYLNHGRDNDRWAINLSSDRIRMAMNLIDGVRHGQDLAALLGYQFERGLHDRNLNLHKYIYVLRDKFPYVSNKLIDQTTGTAASAIEARNVIHGYDLLMYSKTHAKLEGIAGLPALGTTEMNLLLAEVDRLHQSFDALADLSSAETVFQTVQGNITRSGGMMQSVSNGEFPPVPDIISTPRSGNTITHRVCICFESHDGPALIWSINHTPQSSINPHLNHWISNVLPPPDTIQFELSIGNVVSIKSCKDLNIQPLDLVGMMKDTLPGNGNTPLEKFIIYHFQKANPGKLIKINFSKVNADGVSFYHLGPLLLYLRDCTTGYRMLQSNDFLTHTDSVSSNPNQQIESGNLMKLKNTLTDHLNQIKSYALLIQGALEDQDIDGIQNQTEKLIKYGYDEFVTADQESLSLLATSVVNKLLPAVNDDPFDNFNLLSPINQLKALTAVYSTIFKSKTGLYPTIILTNKEEASASYQGLKTMLGKSMTTTMEGWLQSVAHVRNPMKLLENLSHQYSLYHENDADFSPIQLPYLPAEPWIGTAYTDGMKDQERISISVYSTSAIDYSKPISGMLIDEWTEFIPSQKETTGISFQFNRPNASPPQSILIAVPPEIKGKWNWPSLSSVLLETMQRSKIRAIEPDMIAQTDYFQLLPAVLQDFSSGNTVLSTDLLKGSQLQQQ